MWIRQPVKSTEIWTPQKLIPISYAYLSTYCKRGKIRWAKLSRFSRFSRVPRKFFRECKCLPLIILNNKYLRQRKSISAKTLMKLKPWTFSPANLSTSTVVVRWWCFIFRPGAVSSLQWGTSLINTMPCSLQRYYYRSYCNLFYKLFTWHAVEVVMTLQIL